jgi:hypothetical protein
MMKMAHVDQLNLNVGSTFFNQEHSHKWGFLKWGYPKSSKTRGFWMILVLKPMVSGIPHFKKYSNAKNTMAYQIQLERAAFQAL